MHGKSPDCYVLEVLLFSHYLPSFILAPALLSRKMQLDLSPCVWNLFSDARFCVKGAGGGELGWGREDRKLFKGRSRTRTDLKCMF